jgi:tRNA (guanosine-2'-O-)-methyltransferase
VTQGEFEALVKKMGVDAIAKALAPFIHDERRARIEEVLDARMSSLTIVLEDLFDPRNGAAAVRSAEALGLADLHVVCKGRFPLSRGVTLGSQKWITIWRHRSVAAAAELLRARGMTFCAALPDAGTSLLDLDPKRPLALWFGNERAGLSPGAKQACDQTFSIPMHGFTRSFNVSVSFALCAATLAQRRREVLQAKGDLNDAERVWLRARWYVQTVRGARQILANVSKATRHGVSESSSLASNLVEFR